MDLPVEATVHLNGFHNKAEVQEILRSHDFQLSDLSSDRVRVKGSFLKLKAVKASLEQLLDSQAKAYITPAPQASSGAISKHYKRSSSLTRRNKVQDNPSYGSLPLPSRSPSRASGSPKKHPENRGLFSSRLEQQGSVRHRRESFVVDADVFVYADRLLEKDIKGILHSYDVRKEEHQVGDSFNVVVLGENAKIAASKLQNLLDDLRKSLRTQEVHLKEMGREGQALYERIQNNKNIHDSVLICLMNDRLHLIGPSKESYELKLKLLAGQRERSIFRSFRKSRSLSQILQKNRARDDSAIAGPDPKGAAGYSPLVTNHQSHKAAEREHGNVLQKKSVRGRSSAETHRKHREEKDPEQEEHRRPPPRSAKAFFKQLFSSKNIDVPKMFRKSRKKDK